MEDVGRLLLGLGALLMLAGAVVWGLGRLGVEWGSLPGDLSWQSDGGGTRVFAPLGTMLVVSLVLTLLVNLLLRLFR